jgi:DNA-binding NarL/FixJ family response regulator
MRSVRVVIADDTELIRRTVSQVIATCCPNIEVVGAVQDYSELFRVVNESQPDVVLADLNMPCEVDAEQIRSGLASCCLLVMSAWFDEAAKVKAHECGASELLDKSTLAESLGPAIERCLNRGKASAAK